MKKTILTIMVLAISSIGFAQINPIDFETGGEGADWTWDVFENEDNPPLQILANPDQTGANTSATVAEFTARTNGAPFAGTISRDVGTYLLDATNRTITIKVWKPVISDVGIKLETASGFSTGEIKVANTVTNQWEELTFDFSEVPNPPEGEPYNGITIFPDFRERDAETVVYFDDITFSEETTDGGGTTEGNLLTNGDFELGDDGSWFGNALNIQTEGGNSFNFADVTTAGNAFDVNLSQVVDIIPGESYVLTFDASTGAGNTRTMVVGIGQNQAPFFADVETVNLTESTQTFSVDLVATDDGTGEDFGGAEESRVIFDMGADVGVVVIDNVSLELASTGGGDTEPQVAAPTPTRDQADVISLFSTAYNDVPVDTWAAGFSVATFTDSVDIAGTPVKKYAALDFVGIETVSNQIDITQMTNFTVDVWSADYTFFAVKPVDFGPDGAFGGGDDSEQQVEFTTPAQGEWVTFDISLDDLGNLTGRENIAQFILVGQPTGATTIFVDNMYFYKETATSNEEFGDLPEQFELNQNYPNPFNPTTNITYNLPAGGEVTLDVFNIQGQRVATLVSGFKNAGSHLVTFDATNLASGVYTYRLVTESSVQVRKMLLIK